MPDSKSAIKARAESHSDVADSPAARARQMEMGERQLGTLLVRRLREAKGPVTLANFQEEWHQTDDGAVLELSVEATVAAADPEE
jgi:hypothetical protein